MVTDYGRRPHHGMVKLGDADTGPFSHGSGARAPLLPADRRDHRRGGPPPPRPCVLILTDNRAILDTPALSEETLDEAQLAQIFKDVVPRRPWNYQADAAVPGCPRQPGRYQGRGRRKPVPVQETCSQVKASSVPQVWKAG